MQLRHDPSLLDALDDRGKGKTGYEMAFLKISKEYQDPGTSL